MQLGGLDILLSLELKSAIVAAYTRAGEVRLTLVPYLRRGSTWGWPSQDTRN
jgi:hypothetical protein